MPTLYDFISLDTEAAHRAARDSVRVLEKRSRERMPEIRSRLADAKSRLEARRAASDALRKQIELADKDKREADKKALEAQRKNEEAARIFFDKLVSLREAELEAEEAAADAWSWEATLNDRAAALAARKSASDEKRPVTSSEQLSARETGLASAEKEFLEAMKEWTERSDSAAGKRKVVGERRLAAWELLKNVRK
jgi:hypothetical protein